MGARIRLQNHGCGNHPYWWIVVQSENKNVRGRIHERLGYWIPRKTKTVQRAMIINRLRAQYWLGVGATCTNRVHRILEKFGYVPKLPVPFGSKSCYSKPVKEYPIDYFKVKSASKNNRELWIRAQIQEQMTLIQRRRRLMFEAEQNLGEDGTPISKLEEAKTSDIQSDEVDIFERRKKFEELSTRMEKHRKEAAHLRGNDLRYNIYIKKLEKLTRKDLGLDIEAYKDYINNLKHFAHVNADFEIFAQENMKLEDSEYRTLLMLNGKSFTNPLELTEEERTRLRTDEIYNTLRKLKRSHNSHLNDKDRANLSDFMKDIRKYIQVDQDLFEFLKSFYLRQQKDAADREQQTTLEFEKVTPKDLKLAGVSNREYDQIKMLNAIDKSLFQPHVLGAFSPHSMLVNVSKYGPDLNKDAKDILYRPPKMKALYEKYWKLAEVAQGKTKEEFDRKINSRHYPLYVKKTDEEMEYINKLFTKIQLLVEEDIRALSQLSEDSKELQSHVAGGGGGGSGDPGSSGRNPLNGLPTSQLADINNGDEDEPLYPLPAVDEALRKWRKLPEEEKAKLRVNDEIDQGVKTDDLEYTETVKQRSTETNESDDEEEEDEETSSNDESDGDYDMMTRTRINLARAYLGAKGGYSIRQLKKFFYADKKYKERLAQERKLERQRQQMELEGGELKEETGVAEEEEKDSSGEEDDEKKAKIKEAKTAKSEEGKKSEIGKEEVEDGNEEDEAMRLKATIEGTDYNIKGIDEPFSDESDLDEALSAMDEAEFQKVYEQLQSIDIENEEQAETIIKDTLTDWFKNKKKKKRFKPKPSPDKRTQPYEYMLDNDKEQIQSAAQEHFMLNLDDKHKHNNLINANIGRYPVGFRQYENFENYNLTYPERTIQEYHDQMNRQCEFEEYRAIIRAAFIQESENPAFKHAMRIPPFTEDRDVDQLSALEFVDSLDFENEVKSKYKKTVQDYLLSKRWYKLVDCLEEATDYWNYGHDYVTMPLYNVYVPTRNNIVNRPKMNDEHDDETSYRYNLNRLSPFFYLNTLKGYKMSHPAAPKKQMNPFIMTDSRFAKWRKLSRPKRQLFSTINSMSEETENQRRLDWLETQRKTGQSIMKWTLKH